MIRIIKDVIFSSYFHTYRTLLGRDSTKFALGESKLARRNPSWTMVDIRDSDLNLDFENIPYALDAHDIRMCYSSHMFEHISDDAARYLLERVFEKMIQGATLRIEVPCVDKILDDYRYTPNRPIAKYFSQSNEKELVGQRGFDRKFAEEHIGTLGAISCHIEKIGDDYVHTPVYVSKATFESKLSELNNEYFSKWCLSLQTADQYKTHGHINYWTKRKLVGLLEDIGFRDITEATTKKTFFDIDLSIERTHRHFYSVIIEARK